MDNSLDDEVGIYAIEAILNKKVSLQRKITKEEVDFDRWSNSMEIESNSTWYKIFASRVKMFLPPIA